MAASLLAEGTGPVLTNVPDIADVAIMSELLAGLGCDRGSRRRTSTSRCRPTRATRRGLRPGDAGCGRRWHGARAAAGALRPGDRCAAWRRRDRVASLDMHAERAGARSARPATVQHGLVDRVGAAGRTGATADWSSRRVGATETHVLDGSVSRRRDGRSIDNAAREPDLVDLRGVAGARWARRSAASGPARSPRGAVRACCPRRRTRRCRIGRGRHLGGRGRPHPAATSRCAAVGPTTSRAADQLVRPVRWCRRPGRVPGRDGPPAEGGGRGDAAVPGVSRPTCSRWC